LVNHFAAFMSTESTVSYVVCGSKDAFVVFDLVLMGKKWVIAEFGGRSGSRVKDF